MECDDQCDLETLEALIEDSDDECLSAGSYGKNENNDCDQAELDMLASLVANDCDFEESRPSEMSNQTPSSVNSKLGKNKSGSSIKDSPGCLNGKGDRVSSVKQDLTKPCSLEPTLSTQTLLEEMAKIQQKMLEMQKMLEQQQQQQLKQNNPHKEIQQEQNVYNNLKKSPLVKKSTPKKNIPLNNNTGHKMSLPKSGSTETSKIEITNKCTLSKPTLRLLSDNEESPWSQSTTTSPKTSQSAQKEATATNVPPSAKTLEGRDAMKKDLFGDNSDSDWEMDSEDKQVLSESGKDIYKLIQQKRDAHVPSFSLSDNYGSTSQAWARCPSEVNVGSGRRKSMDTTKEKQKEDKNSLQCKTSSSDQAKPATKLADAEQLMTENFSKIRIVNPLISSSLMKLRMDGRKMINVSRIHTKLKTPDLQGDWVTIAVIVGKTDSKSSSSGKPYSIWKLNDLEDLDNSVSFFLFGEVHKHLWKTDTGTVVGVLNPSIMESMEKKNSEPAFTIKNPGQLMIMGRSKDLGWCTGVTKKGNKCGKFINKKFGDACAYHVQMAYRKVSAARLEFHGSTAGMKPKSFEQKIFSKDCAYIYGGQTFVPHSANKSKKGVTLNKLQKNMNTTKSNTVTTLSIQNIKPEPVDSQKGGKIKDDPDSTFIEMISVPSPGSMNLVAFLKNKDKVTASSKSSASRLLPSCDVRSITPKELMKQHEQIMLQKRAEKRKASDQLLAESKAPSLKPSATGGAACDALSQVPILAKGFYGGQDISLEVKGKLMNVADRAKLKAVMAIKGKGGIRQEDPNAVKKSEVAVEKIQKRVQSDCGSSQENVASSKQSATSGEPMKKKSRLLGNVNLNSEEIKSIMKARSKHKGALAEAESEREEVYFNELEKKEKMEEKMLSVTSIEITVVTCKQCLYTAQSAKDSCKKEGHDLTRSKTKKRFFLCKKCKHRTYIIGGKFPTEACRKCGALSFEKTSMCKERTAPKLESEVLNIRGDEIKYLNSMEQKVFLQTVIDN